MRPFSFEGRNMKTIAKIIPIHPEVAELLAGQSRQIETLQS